RPHPLSPEGLAVEVVAENAVAAEEDVEPLAIADGRGDGRAAGRLVAFNTLGRGDGLPQRLARRAIQRHGRQLFVGKRRYENAIAIDARRGMTGRDFDAPGGRL